MIDRRFWIADGRRAEFEAAFAVDGPWARLLRQARGYLFSEVWCELPEPSQYRVKDFWSWHRNFEVFRTGFHAEFQQFEDSLRSERLVEKEQFLGAYYEKFEGGSEEDWVLS